MNNTCIFKQCKSIKMKGLLVLALFLSIPMNSCSVKGRDEDQNNDSSQPVKLSMTDPQATTETKALYANLWLIQQKGVMFGHHDYPSYGVDWSGDADRRECDVH